MGVREVGAGDEMKDQLLSVGVGFLAFLVAFGSGYYAASCHYDEEIAQMNKAQAEAVAQAEKKNAQGLSKATDTILLAQAEYDDLRAERDRLLVRLRHPNRGSSAGGDSAEALRARIAKLEELVGRMAETASRCGDAFERCAEKHDALINVVK